jgi:hypothetical protein
MVITDPDGTDAQLMPEVLVQALAQLVPSELFPVGETKNAVAALA